MVEDGREQTMAKIKSLSSCIDAKERSSSAVVLKTMEKDGSFATQNHDLLLPFDDNDNHRRGEDCKCIGTCFIWIIALLVLMGICLCALLCCYWSNKKEKKKKEKKKIVPTNSAKQQPTTKYYEYDVVTLDVQAQSDDRKRSGKRRSDYY
jgi:hypothetical protein